MIWRRAASSIAVLAFGFGLAVGPMATGPAGATKHNAAKPKGTSTLKASSGTCTTLNDEQAQSSKISTALTHSLASGNFASIKAALLAAFTPSSQEAAE